MYTVPLKPIFKLLRQYHTFYRSMSKRRKTEKVGKGLRHFSMKVCEKVRKKGTTSYNEVADELVAEFANSDINTLAEQVSYETFKQETIIFLRFYLI